MHLELLAVEGHRDPLLEVAFNGQTPDPFQRLRDTGVPDEIVRSLADLMIVDELVGSGRAARVTQFRLGASVGRVAQARTRMGTATEVRKRRARAKALRRTGSTLV